MKKSVLLAAAGLVAGAALFNDARADERAWSWSPVGIGIAAPAQLPFMSTDVYGVRFGGLFGYNPKVYGLDVGVANVVADEFIGIGVGAFGYVGDGGSCALRVSAIANVTTGVSFDLSVAPFNVQKDDAYGIDVGVLNWSQTYAGIRFAGLMNWTVGTACGFEVAPINAGCDDFTGFQIGALNFTDRMTGCQIGCVNLADGAATGVQIGIINAAENMTGVQIGAINIITKSPLPIMVIANAHF